MNHGIIFHRLLLAACCAVLLAGGLLDRGAMRASAAESLVHVSKQVQPMMAKIYGAGGFQGLESYQSGFLISGDGHILTAWSYVLDTDLINVTLHDGKKFQAKMLGADPVLEIAVLKIDAKSLPHFALEDAVELQPGQRVLAFSNLYGVAAGNEPNSILKGIISAKTKLNARRGAFQTPYDGMAYVLDAMTNNPGAAGGALTDGRGRLAGLLGKELKNSQNNTWLNYAIPIADLRTSVNDILAGKIRGRATKEAKKPDMPMSLSLLGISLVPDVLPKTPPFIDRVESGSPAYLAGLRPDDLVLLLNDNIVQSCKTLGEDLGLIHRDDELKLTIMRDEELLEIVIRLPRK